MNDQERIRRGEQARQIIDSPLWLEAWGAYRNGLLEEIERADCEDLEAILRAKRLLVAAEGARVRLEAILADGKVAALEDRKAQERKQWWRS